MAAVMGGLGSDAYDRQYTDVYLFKRLWGYLRRQLKRVLIVTAMGLIISIVSALIPVLISAGIDALETDAPPRNLVLLASALLVSSVIQYAGNWLRRFMTARLIGDLTSQLRKEALAAAIDRDMAFYDENKTGKVLSRITNDTEDFAQTLLLGSDVISQVIQFAFLFFVLIVLNIPLTLLLVVFTVPLLMATGFLRQLARDATRQGSRAMAAVNDTIQETVTGISVAKNFRQEAAIYDEFVKVNQQSYAINLRRGSVLALVFPVLNALAGIGTGAIVYFGALVVIGGTISISVWYLYIQAVDRFWFPLINVASYWSQFQQAMSALERVFALIDSENTVKQIDNQPAMNLAGAIEFDHVTFEYRSGQKVLNNFNLKIQPGENIAFVGHTGAGKSSIAKLIMRLYEFQAGSIRIDGQDIREFDLPSYRRQLGFVPQIPFLFSGTIAENIRFGRPTATDDEIETLAYSIGNGEWLETLPNSLQTNVGERGSQLSIGQRQLVSLLRVLIQKPAVFILDEATASVDSFTESQIQEALEMILAQSTSILIAHRLSTVRSADRIIVLRQGEIIEEGSHHSLMQQGGHYAELYNTYFRHQSLSYIENARAMLGTAP